MTEQIIQFIIRHWMLSLALVLILILLFWEETKNKSGGSRLSLPDATNLVNHQHATFIDIRDNVAFENGHIANALNFSQTDIMSSLEKLKKYQDKPIILVDNTGQQATGISNKLRKQGFNKVYSLAGGLQTWSNAGLPLTKKSQQPAENQRKKLTK